ncbi:hypothetical protein GCM10007877_27770 [Marinibactrum halimedae]|uniref:Dynamin N-terminal domain-containing protein n=2 Tax=Marinibactrum halimedae TaxID=1444977 RepID=A0AA37T8S9_9GAMM|nr:hypothetical protein GCM10007877_27770 [Marinibactrum halimedae]
MCATEIGFDQEVPSNTLQLLPIETRRGATSLNAFKRIPKHWVTIHFDATSPASVQDAVGRIADCKYVSESEARALGFNCSMLNRHPQDIHKVEIPAWRFAKINLNHPLFELGLKLIDTPGLNALGNEPELTLSTLPEAQAVVFMLSADAPISATDKATWRDYISSEDNSKILVVLNKIDSLWEDLSSDAAIEASIQTVRTTTALTFGLSLQQVMPVSAKQAILAKASNDKARLKRSAFGEFESVLTEQLVQKHKTLCKHALIEDAIALIHQTRDQLSKRLFEQDSLLASLQQEPEETNQQSLEEIRANIKHLHRKVHQEALLLKSYQRLLNRQFTSLSEVFDHKQQDKVFNCLQNAASDPESFLRTGLHACFAQIHLNLQKLAAEATHANRLLADIYQRPKNPPERALLKSRLLKLGRRQRQFLEIKHRSEHYLEHLLETSSVEESIVRHFLLSVSQEVRHFIIDLNDGLETWYKQALTPLAYPNYYQKQLLQKELLNLSRVAKTENPRQEQARTMRLEISHQEGALHTLNALIRDIDTLELVSKPNDNVLPLTMARSTPEKKAAKG